VLWRGNCDRAAQITVKTSRISLLSTFSIALETNQFLHEPSDKPFIKKSFLFILFELHAVEFDHFVILLQNYRFVFRRIFFSSKSLLLARILNSGEGKYLLLYRFRYSVSFRFKFDV
jgi:hypothetical protein